MSEQDEHTKQSAFRGYTSPNYTQVPDELFDRQLPELSGAELKVLLYIMRRTFGFKKDSDNISLSQICRGITTRDGRVLDRGTGLSKSTAQLAIKGLLEKGVILTTKRVSKEKGNEATTFELNVGQQRPYTENRHRGAIPEIGTALYRKSSPQETDIQETDIQETDLDLSIIDRSHDIKNGRSGSEEEIATGEVGFATVHDSIRSTLAARLAMDRPDDADAAAAVPSLDELVPRRRGRPSGSRDERDRVMAYLEDFRIELHDEATLAASVTRAVNLFKRAGVPAERWDDLLYEARRRTQEHSGTITKTSGENSYGLPLKNKAPYFFAVLESLIGIRPDKPIRSSNTG